VKVGKNKYPRVFLLKKTAIETLLPGALDNWGDSSFPLYVRPPASSRGVSVIAGGGG